MILTLCDYLVSAWEILTAAVLLTVVALLVNQWLQYVDDAENKQRALAQQMHPSVVSRLGR